MGHIYISILVANQKLNYSGQLKTNRKLVYDIIMSIIVSELQTKNSNTMQKIEEEKREEEKKRKIDRKNMLKLKTN